MRTISVFNNKGGVGKTTFLCNLAASLENFFEKKVLIIDADPQCNATIYLLPDQKVKQIYENPKRQTLNMFLDSLRRGQGYYANTPPVQHSTRFQVDLIPGDPNLSLAEDLLATDWASGYSGEPRGLQTTFVFWDLIDKCSKYKEYDIILFDIGPSLGAINRSVLLSSDFFIMPMSSDIFSGQAPVLLDSKLPSKRESLSVLK